MLLRLISGCTWSDSDHEESGGVGLLSRARRVWNQRSLPPGQPGTSSMTFSTLCVWTKSSWIIWNILNVLKLSITVVVKTWTLDCFCGQVRILRLLRILGHNDETASDTMNDLLAQVQCSHSRTQIWRLIKTKFKKNDPMNHNTDDIWLLGLLRWPPTPTAPRLSATPSCTRPFSPSWTSNQRVASGWESCRSRQSQ